MLVAEASVTAERILDVAQRLVQTRGFNAFSYADIAEELGIRKASIHHHFSTKSDLGRRLLERYHRLFAARLAEIDRLPDPARRIQAYAGVYLDVLKDEGRMCLCGMFAADFATLARPVRDAVKAFFDANEAWLARLLEHGRKAKVFRFSGPAVAQARLLVSSLEGAMLVARSYGDPSRLQETADRLLVSMNVKPARR
jgi:TetR/AcrR family transcriptional regulator, transcriptional repressor for nem operon